jgi:hypothetical protein
VEDDMSELETTKDAETEAEDFNEALVDEALDRGVEHGRVSIMTYCGH